MGSTATISPETLPVDPGGEAACELRVRNIGNVVDQFSFEALGWAAPWVTFEPPSISLLPETEGVTRVVVRPPRASDTAAGPSPMGVKVLSHEDPACPVVEELTVQIAVLSDVSAELIPRASKGRRKAVHHLAVDNRGNAPITAEISASDPDDKLRFRVQAPTLAVDPGQAAFTRVRVRPLRRFLRGPDVSHPFQISVSTGPEPPAVAEGAMVQEALIPRAAFKALRTALLGAIAAGLLWLLVLRPTVKSTARQAANDAVQAPLQMASSQIGGLAQKVGAETPPPLTTAGAGKETPPTAASPFGGLGDPVTDRLQTGHGASTVSATPAGKGRVFSLTDIVLQNPQGDTGLLTLERANVPLLVVRLENFRDLDYHYVAPIIFTGDQPLTLKVDCQNQPPSPPDCTPAVSYNGFSRAA